MELHVLIHDSKHYINSLRKQTQPVKLLIDFYLKYTWYA